MNDNVEKAWFALQWAGATGERGVDLRPLNNAALSHRGQHFSRAMASQRQIAQSLYRRQFASPPISSPFRPQRSRAVSYMKNVSRSGSLSLSPPAT